MTLENSPSLEEFKEGIPGKLSDPSKKRKKVYTFISILFAFVLFLLGVSFAQSNAAEILAGKGAVSGVVFDENHQPFDGYIFIIGTELEAKTDIEGRFLLENIPAGMRFLVIANEYAGYEFPVEVVAGTNTNIGELQFIATALPEE